MLWWFLLDRDGFETIQQQLNSYLAARADQVQLTSFEKLNFVGQRKLVRINRDAGRCGKCENRERWRKYDDHEVSEVG